MRSRHRKRNKETPDLDITAFLNLMVVLVPFLLVSAVFSRVTILELDMPAGAGGGAPDDPTVTVEVVVRKEALEISDGEKVVARFPNLNTGEQSVAGEGAEQSATFSSEKDDAAIPPTEEVYDLKKLSEFLLKVKENYPDKTDSILLLEPDIAYEHLVGVMDTVRGVDVRKEGADPDDPEAVKHVILFPDISIGDAP